MLNDPIAQYLSPAQTAEALGVTVGRFGFTNGRGWYGR